MFMGSLNLLEKNNNKGKNFDTILKLGINKK